MSGYFCSLYFGGSEEEMEFINNLCLELKDYISDYEFEVLFNDALINGNSTKVNNIIYELMSKISDLMYDRIKSCLGKEYHFNDIFLNISENSINNKKNSLFDNFDFSKLMKDDDYLKEVVERNM